MKYLITKQKQVKIFPDNISHSSMARTPRILSAGYFRKNKSGDGIVTFGKSKSTRIKSRKEDAEMVLKKLYQLSRRVH